MHRVANRDEFPYPLPSARVARRNYAGVHPSRRICGNVRMAPGFCDDGPQKNRNCMLVLDVLAAIFSLPAFIARFHAKGSRNWPPLIDLIKYFYFYLDPVRVEYG